MGLNFTAIDFETANFDRGSVCAVGLTKVYDSRVAYSDSWFVYPPTGLDFTNTHIHGIGPDDVSEGLDWPQTLARIEKLLDGDPVVAYSPFDEGVFNSANRITGIEPPEFGFLDLLPVARKHCQLTSHRLPDVAAHLGIDSFDHHDAEADSLACARIALRIGADRHVDSLTLLWDSVGLTAGGAHRVPRKRPSRDVLPKASASADPGHVLCGQVICFSGDLDSYVRAEAQEIACSYGATVTSTVTKKTTLVVIGLFDPARLRVGAAHSTKVDRAMELAAHGQVVEIVNERTFLDILST